MHFCCSCLLCLPYWGGALLNIRRRQNTDSMYEALVARQLPKMVIGCMGTSWLVHRQSQQQQQQQQMRQLWKFTNEVGDGNNVCMR